MSLILFKFLKWGANTELTRQPESPGQEQDNREDGFYIASPETASVPLPWKPGWGNNGEAGTAASSPVSPPSPPFMKCCLGTVLPLRQGAFWCPLQIPPILLSLNQLSPCDRQKLYLDTHFHEPALSLFYSDSVGTSLSHIENAPPHICQMQDLKKEITFILEVYEKYLHPKNVATFGFCWAW